MLSSQPRRAEVAPLTAEEFHHLLAPLGPWGKARRVAVAVSGGADSLCLAWLTQTWGQPTALIVDHRLRPGSTDEAHITARRLAGFGVPSRILTLDGLQPGPGLAARARTARYAALTQAAAELGLCDLLLGHHAGDQAETVLMRQRAGSGPAGLAAMPLLAEHSTIRLVRPLLGSPPGRLRATLRQAGIAWVEDPSNTSGPALRTRLRRELDDPDGSGPRVTALLRQAALHGRHRAALDDQVAATLAERACIHPEGFATLSSGPVPPDCLGALIQMLSGRPYKPDSLALARLAAAPAPATLGGVRLLAAGRLEHDPARRTRPQDQDARKRGRHQPSGSGSPTVPGVPSPVLLLVREAVAMAAPVPAQDGALWDGRFRLHARGPLPDGASVGALGNDAPRTRHLTHLPDAVLRTLPAIRVGANLCAVPHLGFFAESEHTKGWTDGLVRITLCPSGPAAGAAWMGDAQTGLAHHVPRQRRTENAEFFTPVSGACLDPPTGSSGLS